MREVLWSSKLTGQTGSWYGRGNRVFISRLQDCVVSTPCCSTICGQVLKDRTLGRLHLGKVLSSLSWVRMKTAGWENIFIFIYFRYIELQFVVACNNVSSAIFASYKCSLDVRCLIVWTSKCCIIGHTTRQYISESFYWSATRISSQTLIITLLFPYHLNVKEIHCNDSRHWNDNITFAFLRHAAVKTNDWLECNFRRFNDTHV